MRKSRFFISMAFVFLFIFLGQSSPTFAQTRGKIVGVVRDGSTEEVLQGANVMIEGTSIGTAADMNGEYMILRVPPGKHTVVASYLGYRRVVVQGVEVLTSLTTTVNFDLKPDVLQGEELVIVAEKLLVRKDLTSSEARVQADQIATMPVQEVGDLLDLQAGIIRDAGNGLHIRGGRSSEIAYMVNGISITDDYVRQQAFTVANESIQELQVVSGTFNAEYGNAMSGVINIVTKTGNNDFSAKFEAWAGDHVSGRKDIFWNIDDINPVTDYNLQGTFSGPIIKNRLTYFFTGRRVKDDGWLYGPNAYSPQGRSQFIDGDTVRVIGDSSAVAMNYNDRWSGQGGLNWKIMDQLSFKLDFLGSQYKSSGYNHNYRLLPNGSTGSSGFTGFGTTVIARLTHVLSSKTFYELIGSYKENEAQSKLYDSPYDSRYVHPDSLTAGSNEFLKAGTNLFRSYRSTKSLIGKIDLTSQITKRHQVKTGIEVQQDQIDFENITLVPVRDENGLQIEPFEPYIESLSSGNHNLFKREPDKFAVYIQDKIEYENVIMNIGLRFDYFNPNGLIPADSKDPNIYNPQRLNHIYKDSNGDGVIELAEQVEENMYSLDERREFWYQEASAKTQISPRFGIAYPITDNGVIHFSYGIFQQIPEYRQLYESDQIKLSEGQGIWGPFGNPDLNPQRTTMYELGLKQQISDNIGIDVTGYYRDIRDWISSSAPIPTYVAGVTYSKMINRDYANVKGIVFTVTRRLANMFLLNLDYTYQVVQGTNSSPEDEYLALNNGAEPKRQMTPLDWDQRHILNLNVFVGKSDVGCNMIARLNSGQPYTPDIPAGTLTGQNILPGLATNTRRRPNRFTVDLNAFKRFALQKFNCEVFLRIYNVFDSKNPLTVWADSGKPDYTIYQEQEIEADPTWYVRPDYYSEPRRIQIGTKISFQ
ncbi:TonB-dependent receptor [candidate division KSB1 bacterium]|nr:TonB-dependent receptor [candidate division KSB1 bacterium]